MVFKEHGLMLFLDADLYLSFVKLQADKRLGRSYAGLLAFVEGLHEMGYLNERQYEAHKRRYSIPLDKNPRQVTFEEHAKIQERNRLNRRFGQVIEQWPLHQDKAWRDIWIQKAREHGALPNAKRLLTFVEEKKAGVAV